MRKIEINKALTSDDILIETKNISKQTLSVREKDAKEDANKLFNFIRENIPALTYDILTKLIIFSYTEELDNKDSTIIKLANKLKKQLILDDILKEGI